ncbi:hypothetical protein [Truepera radiovictrix]|uniref:Uncharacterized protein n=1 Tax=Truepera radiovictrix (strain DSM 17093 / CIP 108686 / LMG 22925 / RQ-24) TaxID=649638 RepID=D7CTU4_TRURR|nr:hypothetical protein [Truepera radiovictrix]ADI15641.1 hypothetical protein Trad_2535 [Truepera radiovictrix DSM 17093]WMT58730.1 hypothetical protein RCV51_07235 [Truepera radiovictrix]
MTHSPLKRYLVPLAPLALLALVACNDPWDRQQGEPKTFVPVITHSEAHDASHGETDGEAHGETPAHGEDAAPTGGQGESHGGAQGAAHTGQEQGHEAPAQGTEGGH